jgi:predicted kinase
MPTITLTRGLPGSGKTTWALQRVRKHRGNVVIIDTGDLRQMLHGDPPWPPSTASLALEARDRMVELAMREGKRIILTDPHLDPEPERRIERLVETVHARHPERPPYGIVIQDFTDVPLKTCIARDLLRPRSAGERVIRDLHARYLRHREPAPLHDPGLPDCIICDLDGTLAVLNGRDPYDATTCEQDTINEHVWDIVRRYTDASLTTTPCALILFSGRHARHRAATERWLARHGVTGFQLVMRADDDNRKDAVIKREFFDAHVRGRYNVQLVIDDRLQVCRMWHDLGLPLLRAGDPDADV